MLARESRHIAPKPGAPLNRSAQRPHFWPYRKPEKDDRHHAEQVIEPRMAVRTPDERQDSAHTDHVPLRSAFAFCCSLFPSPKMIRLGHRHWASLHDSSTPALSGSGSAAAPLRSAAGVCSQPARRQHPRCLRLNSAAFFRLGFGLPLRCIAVILRLRIRMRPRLPKLLPFHRPLRREFVASRAEGFDIFLTGQIGGFGACAGDDAAQISGFSSIGQGRRWLSLNGCM